jgi:SAM-dependent methyltransferase
VRDDPGVHEAVVGFARTADRYERGRPGYPAAAVDFVIASCRLGPGQVVVDIGAGTGKFTRELVRSGARVIAVEPLDEMRAQLVDAVPSVEATAGTAERTGLGDGIARAVTAAQAFHWFSTAEALGEIARILEPGGTLALVWNRRDTADPLQAELSALLERHRGSEPSHTSGAWRDVLEGSELFVAGEEFRCDFQQELDADGVADRFGSISFIGALPTGARDEVAAELRALVPPGGTVVLPYVTEVSTYRLT